MVSFRFSIRVEREISLRDSNLPTDRGRPEEDPKTRGYQVSGPLDTGVNLRGD